MTTRRPGHFHAVKFFESGDALGRIGAEFLGEGLAARQPAARHRDTRTSEEDYWPSCAPGTSTSRPWRRPATWSVFDADSDARVVHGGRTARCQSVSGDRGARARSAVRRPADPRLRRGGRRALEGRPRRSGHPARGALEPPGGDPRHQDAVRLLGQPTSTRTRSLRAIFDEHSHVVSDKGALVHAHPTVRWGGPAGSQPAVVAINSRLLSRGCGGSTAAAIASVA